jgi:hypothetical protein
MPTYRVLNTGGNGDGSNWTTQAITTLKDAIEGHATSAGDIILVDKTHVDALATDTTFTIAADIRIICVDSAVSDVSISSGAVIGSQATNYSLFVNGGFVVFFSGITFQTGTNTNVNEGMYFTGTDAAHYEFDNCKFKFSNVAQEIAPRGGTVEFQGCTVDAAGSAPTELFAYGGAATNCRIVAEGCDFSHCTTLVGDFAGNGKGEFLFSNCKVPTGIYTIDSVVPNKGSVAVWVFNCDDGDEHFRFAHYDPFGSTVAQTTIYANDGAKYDGSNGCAWVVTSTAYCSFYTPYLSPWIDKYHNGTSAITPSLEILRDGSAAAYQNDEVWGEFSYQGTSGSTQATIASDRMALLGTAADQTTGSLSASGWTGENATAWFGKLESGSITPAEIGHLRARVCVGEPSITVYVDPKIRIA